MLRVLDLRRALEARGWGDDGAFAVDVGGERWAVHVEEGRARAQTPKDEPVLKLDRTALAEVLFGGLPVEDAVRLGRASGDAPAIAEAARMLAGPPFSWVDEF
jgi:predicted acetyltransferase